ncbi:hypothetical protein HYT01_03065 [Candidatus Giovannonibacteria bacterium]|nr:hypothetical protein [Candidatus Giovannonibacteria bacterium]
MWKNWAIAILGILVLFAPYAGLSYTWERLFIVVLGIIISILGFWNASEMRVRSNTEEHGEV